jgi:hypothetical protein
MRLILSSILCWLPSLAFAQYPPAPTPTYTEQVIPQAPQVIYQQAPQVVYNQVPQIVYQQAQPQVVYQQAQQNICPKCGRVHGVGAPPSPRNGLASRLAGDGHPLEYIRPGYESAYEMCRGDVQFYAAGNRYPGRFGGHPPQFLRGGLAAGTGYSWDQNRPNHCYYREGRTLVARARLVGPDGKVWWSARYK